jgi:hypothetical protein
LRDVELGPGVADGHDRERAPISERQRARGSRGAAELEREQVVVGLELGPGLAAVAILEMHAKYLRSAGHIAVERGEQIGELPLARNRDVDAAGGLRERRRLQRQGVLVFGGCNRGPSREGASQRAEFRRGNGTTLADEVGVERGAEVDRARDRGRGEGGSEKEEHWRKVAGRAGGEAGRDVA